MISHKAYWLVCYSAHYFLRAKWAIFFTLAHSFLRKALFELITLSGRYFLPRRNSSRAPLISKKHLIKSRLIYSARTSGTLRRSAHSIKWSLNFGAKVQG